MAWSGGCIMTFARVKDTPLQKMNTQEVAITINT